ncbi:MAG TPA: hypothetical protein VE127_00445, partial [Solirubrobacteraceae bacterium]|nr:hypothetical protein [Solirubrobacteraceae bacterium]
MDSFRDVLNGLALVDHHAHGLLRRPPRSLDEFRGLLSESTDPRQWPHVAWSLTYRRAMRALAEHVGCAADEQAVYEARRGMEWSAYAESLLRATGTERLLVDTGFPAADVGTSVSELGELAGCEARPVLRIEAVAEGGEGGLRSLEAVAARIAAARAEGYVALKTVAAYRGGL